MGELLLGGLVFDFIKVNDKSAWELNPPPEILTIICLYHSKRATESACVVLSELSGPDTGI